MPANSIIILAHNEEKSIGKVIKKIPSKIRESSELIVASSSLDKTDLIAKKAGARIVRVWPPGKGRGMRKGAACAKGKRLVFMDADGEHDPRDIPRLLKALEKSDIVLGCRGIRRFKRDNFPREIYRIQAIPQSIFFLVAGRFLHDPQTGFIAIRRREFLNLSLKSNGFEIAAEFVRKASRLEIKELPIPTKIKPKHSSYTLSPKSWLKTIKVLLAGHL